MQRNFLQVKNFLEERFPELRGGVISGGNYPPPASAILAQKLLSYVQMFTLVAMVVGESIWTFIPFIRSPPKWYYGAKQNPVPFLIGIFLIVPTIVQSYMTTGAFEISLNHDVLFSKIEQGRFPTAQELIAMFKQAGLTEA